QPPDHRISVFVCPSDEVNLGESRGLSYVVNVGYGLMTPECIIPVIHRDEVYAVDDHSKIFSQLVTTARADNLDGYVVSTIFAGIFIGSELDPDRLIGLDWNQDGEITTHEDLVTEACGVFWSGPKPTNRAFSVRRINEGDGTSNTLMMSERNRLRDWAVTPESGASGIDPFLRLRYLGPLSSHGMGMSTAIFRYSANAHVMPKFGAWSVAQRDQELWFESMAAGHRKDCKPEVEPPPTNRIINRSSRWYLPPMSAHAGGVNTAFCDGSIHFMSEDIDPTVFALMLSSGGVKYGQRILGDDEF
ncbi:MAG: DUF1559 domain-containing protein, partial [Planctomycetaceae bacterium]|nr:DUF1559 domain-containing protein [Planctomycetaceae bacterium]